MEMSQSGSEMAMSSQFGEDPRIFPGIMSSEEDLLLDLYKLHESVIEMSERGLHYSSAWASELLDSFVNAIQESGSGIYSFTKVFSPENDWKSFSALLMGKSYFDCKEYQRCAMTLEGIEHPFGIFLKCYALYLDGEIKKRQERLTKDQTDEKFKCTNPNLMRIYRELSAMEEEKIDMDGYLLFVYVHLLFNSFV